MVTGFHIQGIYLTINKVRETKKIQNMWCMFLKEEQLSVQNEDGMYKNKNPTCSCNALIRSVPHFTHLWVKDQLSLIKMCFVSVLLDRNWNKDKRLFTNHLKYVKMILCFHLWRSVRGGGGGLYEDLGQSHSFNGTQVMVLTLTKEEGEKGERGERGERASRFVPTDLHRSRSSGLSR